jgi:hypothetical protein
MRTHTLFAALIAGAAALGPSPAAAQFKNGNQTILLSLPRVSQRAVVTQRIGLTDITIVYHRPLARGRQIFGDVVSYDRVWRAGANDNTTIEFADPVTVEGHTLPAGRYGIHMIPGRNEWTVILSTNSTSWGSFFYDAKEDAVRVKIKPLEGPFREALTFEFGELKPDSAVISLAWERVVVPFKVSVDVKSLTLASLRLELRHLPTYKSESWFEAALYCVDNDFNYPEALQWVEHAIQDEERFDNLDLKAQILERLGRREEATAFQAKALTLATPEQMYLYGDRLLREKKLDAAEKVLRGVTRDHPEAWLPWYGLAKVQVARGDRAAAEKSLREALSRASARAKPGVQRMLERLAAGQSIG